MSKPKYIIIEMPTPLELAEEVSKHIEGTDTEFYYPSGSVICHPSSPSDPQRPFRFSQPMLLCLRTPKVFGGTLAENLAQGRAGIPMAERAAAIGQAIKERETALLSEANPTKYNPPADNVQ